MVISFSLLVRRVVIGAEDEKHRAAVREFIDSSGQIVTPLDIALKYRLGEISGAWFGRKKYPRYD